MAHHPPIQIDAGTNQPNPSFFSWLRGQTALFISQILSFGSVLLSLSYYSQQIYEHSSKPEFLKAINLHIQIFVDIAHIVVLTVFIIWLFTVLDENDKGRYRVGLVYNRVFNEDLTRSQRRALRRTSRTQLLRFKKYFLCFWCVMWVLYMAFLFKHGSQLTKPPALSINGEVAVSCTNSEPGPCFNVPATTVDARNKVDCPPGIKGSCYRYEPTLLHGSQIVPPSVFPFLTFALNNISLLFIFLCFSILYLPAHDRATRIKQKRLVYYSAIAVVFLTHSFPLLLGLLSPAGISTTGLTDYFTLFDAASGMTNAIVLAMLIARLDSKFIGLPARLICILYCYSAVQPFFAVFEQPAQVFQTIQSFVLILVFLFKVYFFLIIIFALQSGRMLNYLFCFPYLDKRVDSIFENQFEIKSQRDEEHAFRFSILKNNELKYVTDGCSKTREEDDDRIEKLREAMKHTSSYELKEQAGTHWIEIRDSDHKVFCHSMALRSQDEARNLIEESIEAIPYCKYNRV